MGAGKEMYILYLHPPSKLYKCSDSPDSISDIKAVEFVVVAPLEVREGTTHFDPGVPRPHPEKLRNQLLDAVTENNRHPTSPSPYLVFISTGTTPLC